MTSEMTRADREALTVSAEEVLAVLRPFAKAGESCGICWPKEMPVREIAVAGISYGDLRSARDLARRVEQPDMSAASTRSENVSTKPENLDMSARRLEQPTPDADRGDGGWRDFRTDPPKADCCDDMLAVLVDHEGKSESGYWYVLLRWDYVLSEFIPANADSLLWRDDVKQNGTRIVCWKRLQDAPLVPSASARPAGVQ